MEFPKLVYDDFYKFLMSFGVILFVISVGLGVFIANDPILGYQWIFVVFCILAFISSIMIMRCAGGKWYKNQRLLDRKLELETRLLEEQTEIRVKPEEIKGFKVEDKANVALVTYKIASSFPELNTKPFNFLTDWQVWFLIENREKKKYRAYIKIEFISEGHEEPAGGSYGGTVGWKLNALSGVIAPGLGIPGWIKEKALQRKPIKIRILCEIKDENDELVEKKLPAEYAYNYENNSWYFVP